MSPNTTKKVAFIGAGYMTVEHLKVFNDIDGVICCGITSRTQSHAQEVALRHGVPAVYNSISEMYEVTKADAVVISVPELSTREVVFEAFKYPWKILIEKPVGYNLEDAYIIVEEAKRMARDVFVALNRRHYSSTERVIGDLNRIDGKRLITICDQEDAIAALAAGQPKKVVDNWMYANSIHVIDLFQVFARGQVTKIDHLIRWDRENPFIVIVKIDFESEDIGIYQAVWNAPGPWSVTVSTPMKRFEMRPLERATVQNKGERSLSDYPVEEWDQKFKPGLRKQAQRFIDFLNTGDKEGLPTLEQSFATMKLISKIYSQK